MTTMLQLAQTLACTEAEGPGRRFAIWFQGCPLRCVECCNPEMLPFSGGSPMSVASVVEEIFSAREQFDIEGITLIGGEPFAHAAGAAALAREVRAAGLTVMVFSGYTIEALREQRDEHVAALLRETDLLVDGRFEKDQPDSERRWIGSANQRIHFLTDAYSPDDQRWRENDTLEIRWDGSQILINGFPATDAKALWKPGMLQPKRKPGNEIRAAERHATENPE